MNELVRDWKAEKKDLEEVFDIIADKLVKADAEIEKLKIEVLSEKNSHYSSLQLWGEKEDRLKALITELCDALEGVFGRDRDMQKAGELVQRARKAAR